MILKRKRIPQHGTLSFCKDNTFILQFNHSYKIFFETPENFPK